MVNKKAGKWLIVNRLELYYNISKDMKKLVFLLIIVIIIISAWLGQIYINRVFIPQKLRPLLAEKLSAQLERKVEFEFIGYKVFEGFTLKKVRLFNKAPSDDEVLLDIEKIRFNILIPPILKSRKIIIPAVYLDSPTVHLKYEPGKTPNLLETEPSVETEITPMTTNLIIKNGTLLVEDSGKEPPLQIKISNINAALGLSLPQKIKFSLEGFIKNSDQTQTSLTINGSYNLKNSSFTAESKLENILLTEYVNYLPNLPFSILKARVEKLEISTQKDSDWINSKYIAAAEDINLAKDELVILVAGVASGEFKFNPAEKKLTHQGQIDISQGAISGIPFVKEATNIKANLRLSPDSLRINNLTAETLGSFLEINGEVNNFNQPDLDLTLKIGNSSFGFKGKLDIKENASPSFNLEGPLSLNLKELKQISAAAGQNLKIPDLDGNLEGSFNISGSSADITGSQIRLKGQSPQIKIDRFKFDGLSLDCRQKDKQIQLDLSSKAYQGTLKFSANFNTNNPQIDYSANLSVKNLDLEKLKTDTSWKDKNTLGKINFTASLQGEAKDLPTATGNAQLSIKDGYLWELNLLQGLGKLLLPGSFDKIVFRQVEGNFLIGDKKVRTNDLTLNSDELRLDFKGGFDFDGNLDGDILANFSDKIKNESQGLEGVISSILSQAQKYVTVKLNGSLKKPTYKIKAQPQRIFDEILNRIEIPKIR